MGGGWGSCVAQPVAWFRRARLTVGSSRPGTSMYVWADGLRIVARRPFVVWLVVAVGLPPRVPIKFRRRKLVLGTPRDVSTSTCA